MNKNYYEILGITKTASADDIKRAYRKLAHQHHPDKTGHADDAKFKEINEAYQVLSDPQKRQMYDQFGTVGVNNAGFGSQGGYQGSPFGGAGFEGFGFSGGIGDIFETIFSQAFSQVQTEFHITLTQAILGEKVQLQTSAGDTITLNIPPGTQDGETFRFRGKGAPSKKGRGDLLVTVRIQMPQRITREQKELLEQLRRSGM